MRRFLLFLILLPLIAGNPGCGDDPLAANAEVTLALEILPAQGVPALVRATATNVGNTNTVTEAGCWFITFIVTDAGGNPAQMVNPCFLSLVDCAPRELVLSPGQHYASDLEFGKEWATKITPWGYPRCTQVALDPGDYTVTARFHYRPADDPGGTPVLITANATVAWTG